MGPPYFIWKNLFYIGLCQYVLHLFDVVSAYETELFRGNANIDSKMHTFKKDKPIWILPALQEDGTISIFFEKKQ